MIECVPASTPRVILITDPAYGDDALVRSVTLVARALPRGAFGVQLRDKKRTPASLRIFASRLRLVTRAFGARLFVNGNATIARDIGADGVHLGFGAGTVADARAIAGRSAFITVATHCDDDVRRARDDGADGVFVAPVFPTRASPASPEKLGRGLDAIRSARLCGTRDLLIYALGGVGPDRAAACAAAGADGVAAIRALLTLRPERTARAIDDAFARRW